MWELIECGAILLALIGFLQILFHNPIRTTEEWDNEESDKDEK